MNRALPTILAALALATCAAAPARPPIDRDALEDATGAARVEGYASARAYLHYLEARLAELRGDVPRAIEELRLAAIYDPTSADVRLALGWLFGRIDAFDRAEVEARKALALAPDLPGAQLLLGRIYVAQHRRLPAIRALEAAIAGAPAEPEAYLALIQLHADLGDESAARAVVARLGKIAPGEAEGYRILARLALDRGDSNGAVKDLEEAATRDTWDFDSRLRLGQLHERAGRYDSALVSYSEILAKDPSHEEALLGAARLSLARGDDASARAYVDRLVGTAEDAPRSLKRAAITYAAARRFREALSLLDEAGRLDPGDPDLPFHRGAVLEDNRQFAGAARAYEQVPPTAGDLYAAARARAANCLSRDRRHLEALRRVGEALAELAAGRGGAWGAEVYGIVPDVYRRAGRVGQGLELLEAAAARDPAPELLLALARSLEDDGRAREAILRAREAYRQRPGDERFRMALAATLERNDQLDAAVALAKGALERDPDNVAALNFLGFVWADRGVHLDEALPYLERAANLRPDDGAILDSLGWLLVRRGEVGRAARLLERADALSPDDPVVLDHLAEAYARLGRSGDAVRTWSRALRLLEDDPQPRIREEIEAKLRKATSAAKR